MIVRYRSNLTELQLWCFCHYGNCVTVRRLLAKQQMQVVIGLFQGFDLRKIKLGK